MRAPRLCLIGILAAAAATPTFGGFSVVRTPPPNAQPTGSSAPAPSLGEPASADSVPASTGGEPVSPEETSRTTPTLNSGWGSADGTPSMYVNEAPSAEEIAAQIQTAQAAQVQALMSSSPFLKIMEPLAKDPQFISGVMELVPSPRHKEYIITQLAFLFFMIAFRSWRSKQHDHWAGRLWVRVYCFAILTVVSSTLIPSWIYGAPYTKVMNAVSRHFF